MANSTSNPNPTPHPVRTASSLQPHTDSPYGPPLWGPPTGKELPPAEAAFWPSHPTPTPRPICNSTCPIPVAKVLAPGAT